MGEFAYFAINALLPIALVLLVRNFDTPYPALVLVALSKWRVFALRPRFWWTNIKANLVDFIVGISVVGLMFLSQDLIIQYILAVGYGVWLLYLKPKSNNRAIMLQAGIAQFLSLAILFNLSPILNDAEIIAGCWIIGYVVARHVLGSYDEEFTEFISAFWGLFVAQLGWILNHWSLSYAINAQLQIKIPQISLLVLVISFAVSRLYVAAKLGRLKDSAVRITTASSAILLFAIIILTHWDAGV